jgi:chromosome segregation ATPase
VEQTRHLEASLDKARGDCTEFRRTISALQDRAKQLDQQAAYQGKENEDLKHDNTVLY